MSADQAVWGQAGFEEAYSARERQERLRSGKVACALVVFLMPAGITLDLIVYPDRWFYFLQLRLLCSALAGGLWFVHTRPLGQRYYRFLGIPIAILPAFFIAWMIAVTEGPLSPYYAGLILILLAVNAVVHWSTTESFIAIAVLLLLYLAACLPWDLDGAPGIFFNNIYFLVLTGIIVVVGNHLYDQLHFREFALRFELDQNRKKLEKTNRKLVELDEIKSRFFANISHELRTPLTLMLAPLESLIQDRGSSFDLQIRELLVIMQGNGLRLLKLINDLLDLVRLESGKMEVKREPVTMEPFLRGLSNAIRKTAEDRGVRLETTVDAGLSYGAYRQRQAGENLTQSVIQRAQIHARRRSGATESFDAKRGDGSRGVRHGRRHQRRKDAVCLRPLLASGYLFPKEISWGWHRFGVGQRACGGPRRHSRSEQSGGPRQRIHRAFALPGVRT